MLDVRNKRCTAPGCTKLSPCFNVEGQTRGIFCADHKLDNMVDVFHARCQADGCKARAHFGLPGLALTRCTKHALAGMLRNSRKRCATDGCTEVAVWGSSAHTATHCDTHKQEGQLNIVEGACACCGLLDVLKQDKTCGNCGESARRKRAYLLKQQRMKEAIETAGLPIKFYDVVVESMCNKKRLEVVIDAGTHMIDIECDEHQHRSYACEDARMCAATEQLGMRTIFVRFNPDSFRTDGVWKNPPEKVRFRTLVDWVNHLLHAGVPEHDVSALYLFYDGYDERTPPSLQRVVDPGFTSMQLSNAISRTTPT